MAIPVIMPKQGQSVETCIITKWFKKKGDEVKTGDILFSYETDKAAFDFESAADGIILEIFCQEGTEVAVLSNVAVIGSPGEKADGFIRPGSDPQVKETVSDEPVVEPKAIISTGEYSTVSGYDGGRIKISPRARRFADKKGIDYTQLRGTGPNGRIICNDVMAFSKPTTSEASEIENRDDGFTDKPLTNIRKLIARSMHFSLSNSAQLTHHMSADVRRLLDARRKIKEMMKTDKSQQDITLNDMICLCVIRALAKYPEANSHYYDDHIRIFSRVHLGIAVDTPRGLMVPAIRNADKMDLVTLSKSLKSAADDCKKGSIDPGLIQSTAASFTVSNLGNYGVEMFTPVINLPQCAILGVCTIINRPADLGDNIFGFVPYIGLSLTYDHRAIDGGPATLFLREIKNEIENFSY
jgi:pyruvate dehydrogenase E2 component (dihydrolipoamide acetyltransferase)